MKDINSNFKKDYNAGEIPCPDAVGESIIPSSADNHDYIKLTAKITGNLIKDIKFKARGANYTIAAADYLASLAKNMDILDSTLLTGKNIEEHLGEFPPEKKYVLDTAISALNNLITDYISKPRITNIYKLNKNKVAVALSGGIDSSMAAEILKERGYELIGVTLKLLPDNFNDGNNKKTYCLEEDIKTAREVAAKLNIPHIVLDLIQPFKEKIINPFCAEYKKGLTPNPCVECNKYIKFGILLEKVKYLGAAFIATGHYCRIEKSNVSGLYEIKKGADNNKDQSYMLWRLSQVQLSFVKTPLGDLSKTAIKKRAKKIFPFLKEKDESQDICFIKDNNYHSFLKSKLKNIKQGPILDSRGKIIGTHKGYAFYTIGQRKGLGVSYTKPLYVKEIIPKTNTIIAGEEKDIMQKKLKVKKTNFIAGAPPESTFRAMVRIRYKSSDSPAEVKITGKETASIILDKPEKAVTPGQSAVFYNNDTLLGGGVIKRN
jgi:tRNA-uridine 2-sulfurtransferase